MKSSKAIKTHFLNSLIWRGRKVTAEKFFNLILMNLKQLNAINPIDVFYFSSLNLRPLVFLMPVKVGSVTYWTPAPISNHKRRLYAIKFILQSARDSRGSVTVGRISALLNSIYFANKNPASEKKFALYKEAMDNRAFIRKLRRIL